MNLSLRACFLMVYCFLTLATFAQENYQNGYIVLRGKDTVRGQIDFRDWASNPRQISFLDQAGKKRIYQPEGLPAFFVSGEIYRTYSVKIYPYSMDAAVTSAESLPANPYDSTVFLRLVTEGRLNLYYYRDHSGITYFFIQRQTGAPEQLRIMNMVVEKDGKNTAITNELFQYQLADLVGDCAATAQRPVRVTYSEKALRKLIFTYNNCGKDTVDQANRSHHDKIVSFTPLIGYFNSTVRISGDQDIAKMTWPSYSSVTGGVGMLVAVPRSRGRFSFFADLLYRHFSSRSSTYLYQNDLLEHGLLEYSQAQLDIQFRYRFQAGKVRPFLNIGFSNSLIINNKSTLFAHDNAANIDYVYPIFGIPGGMRSFQTGLIGGGGISFRRFSLEARIERPEDLSLVSTVNAPMTNFFLLAGFSF